LNFLILVNTPYQLFVSYILSYFLKEVTKCSIDLILIENIMKKYKDINNDLWDRVFFLEGPSEFSVKNIKTNYLLMKEANIFKEKYFKNKNIDCLFIFVDQHPVNAILIDEYKRMNKGKIVFVEEGVAPYNKIIEHDPLKIKIKKIIKYPFKKILKWGNPLGKNIGTYAKTDIALMSNPKLVTSSFAKNADFYSLPQGSFPDILVKNFLRMINLDIKKQIITDSLFLSQPLSEAGIIKKEMEYLFLKNLINIFKNNGQKLFFKPHPRDSEDKIKYMNDIGFICLSIDQDLPVEILFHYYKLRLILTVNSSGALNYSMRYKGSTLWLEELLFKKSTSFLTVMESNYLGNVYKIKKWDQLEDIIKYKKNDKNDNFNNINVMEKWIQLVKYIIEYVKWG
jgi:Alpha-2,8-polysialyltransferase (POLYST)